MAPGMALNSIYDTSALRETLARLVDFDRVNAGETRLAVGTVNVETGDFRYFDSRDMRIGPEHVMASAALPPAFPPVEIDGAFYWDGGIVSNTPLEHVINYYPRRSRLTFQVDVFAAHGVLPRSIEEVLERQMDIRFSSRPRKGTDDLHTMHDIRHNLMTLLDKLPEELRQTPEAAFLDNIACVTRMDIAQVIYRPCEPQGSFKDYEFTRRTMRALGARF
jgi:NTE family protein